MPSRIYSARDFVLTTMKDGSQHLVIKSLTNNNVQVNLSLVAFKTHKCPHCQALEKEYEILASRVDGVSFDAVYLDDDNMSLVGMSQRTPFAIKGIPLLVLFVNGVGFTRFPQGVPRDFKNITDFLTANVNKNKDGLSKFITEIKFAMNNNIQPTNNNSINKASELQKTIHSLSHESTGVPVCQAGSSECNGLYTVLCNDAECYITMSDMQNMNPTTAR